MYRNKSQESTENQGGLKRFLAIIIISAFVIWVGTGCRSLSGDLEIDTTFFDISYEGKVSE